MKNLYLVPLVISLLLFTSALRGQSYDVSVTSEPYHDLIGGIRLVDTTWDDPAFIVPLGFNFQFFGDMTTDLYSPEVFTGGIFTTNLDINALNLILPFAVDLVDRGYNIDTMMSPISYKTEGAPGSRTTTIEYKNAGFYGGNSENGVYDDFINIQFKLVEKSGEFSVHIGPYSVTDVDLDFEGSPGPVIGFVEGFDFINQTASGEVLLLNGNPLNPTLVTTFSETYVNWPIPENLVYTFKKAFTAVHDESKPELGSFYYPNPTTQYVSLKSGINAKIISDVNVINTNGTVVKTDNKPERIELEDLPAGIYVLRFQTDAGMVTQRILLQR